MHGLDHERHDVEAAVVAIEIGLEGATKLRRDLLVSLAENRKEGPGGEEVRELTAC